jgi:site-specific DNA recombinase
MEQTKAARSSKVERKAYGYVRVSTAGQAETGVSLDAQREKIRAMSVVLGVGLSEIISDAGESAKTTCRPGLERLLDLVDSGKVQTVVIAKLDRLTRSVKDLAELLERFQRKGVALVSVAESLDTSSAAGRLVLNIMVSVSQWEREAIGERTATALHFKKASGRVYNHAPYGFTVENGSLIPQAQEQSVIARIKQYRAAGRTLQWIADELNRSDVKTKFGRNWFPQTVKDVLLLNRDLEVA